MMFFNRLPKIYRQNPDQDIDDSSDQPSALPVRAYPDSVVSQQPAIRPAELPPVRPQASSAAATAASSQLAAGRIVLPKSTNFGHEEAHPVRPFGASSQALSTSLEASSSNQSQLLPQGRMGGVQEKASRLASMGTAPNNSILDANTQREVRATQIPPRAPTTTDSHLELVKTKVGAVFSFNNDLREQHKAMLEHPPEPSTLVEYGRVRVRAFKRDLVPIPAMYENSNTRQKVRCSIIWGALEAVPGIIGQITTEARSPSRDLGRIESLVRSANLWKRRVEAMNTPYAPVDSTDNKQRRRSARRDLSKAVDGWEFDFFARIQTDPVWGPATAVMLLAGVRPKELVTGVDVEAFPDRTIELAIVSAKQGGRGNRSVGVRRLAFRLDTPWSKHLAELASGRTTPVRIRIDKAGEAWTILKSTSGKNIDGRKYRVIPYMLRHRFCALLKGSGLSDVDIAAAMGHASTKTMTTYGTYNIRTAGGSTPVRITVERTPRDNAKPTNPPRKKRGPRIDID
jgi:integrase